MSGGGRLSESNPECIAVPLAFTQVRIYFELGVSSVDHQAAAQVTCSTSHGALRRTVNDVIQIWLHRLQLVSSLATFFASTDALLFTLSSFAAHTGSSEESWTVPDRLTTASLAGALIFHVGSAIVAFIGSFVLCRYELLAAEAVSTLPRVEYANHSGRQFSTWGESTLKECPLHRSPTPGAGAPRAEDVFERVWIRCLRLTAPRVAAPAQPPHVETGSLSAHPAMSTSGSCVGSLDLPVQRLSRCLDLSVIMACLGFVLALLGILAYAWSAVPISISIFASACVGSCFLLAAVALW
ncbi:uncharacterized protein FIBRA_08732 [Fibroporia radiculosa]|uniref:Uncharacterized protein n=1 Tax=Fibroporia radiculosa TaxID=599839 RepID=J4I388_9APHY|nr:uncharacterized protein FIBRA_08732 [Fibroporia radiculosa]CCM06467.1 predicted protein [Fibroporia radiculosa]